MHLGWFWFGTVKAINGTDDLPLKERFNGVQVRDRTDPLFQVLMPHVTVELQVGENLHFCRLALVLVIPRFILSLLYFMKRFNGADRFFRS